MMILCLRFLRMSPFDPSLLLSKGTSSSVSRVRRMFAMRAPSAFDWFQPPYVRGGS